MGNALVKAPEGEIVHHEPPARFSAEALIATAIERGLPLDTLERLLAMRDKLKAEQAREEFFAALSAFQGECPVIVKSKGVHDRSDRQLYRYASLGDILKVVGPLLKKHGLSYRLVTTLESGTTPAQMVTVCTVHHAAGHSEASSFRVPLEKTGVMNNAQTHGSARTYACRYAFCDAFGIMTGEEDDDATSLGTGKPPQQPKQAAQPAKPTPQSASKPENGLPPTGTDLRDLLAIYDKQFTTETLIVRGELLSHVARTGTDQGWSDDITTWDDPEQIQFAAAEAKRFIDGKRAAKTHAPSVNMAGVEFGNWLDDTDKRLYAEGVLHKDEDPTRDQRGNFKHNILEKVNAARRCGTEPSRWKEEDVKLGHQLVAEYLAELCPA